mgnify:CR=1 FL=1
MAKREKCTLGDIAREANVSPATVSMILRGTPGMRFSEETVRRVSEAADALGIPLVKLLSSLSMMTPTGLAVLCIGSSTCESVFLYVGYMESIPKDIEEAAYIDGASTAQTFYRIVLPLLKPILATAMIKDGLWIWNDYMLPLLTLNKSANYWTLTLFAYNFQSENAIDYGATFACYCLQMLPIMVFYVFMQKNIIGGLTAGAVKS